MKRSDIENTAYTVYTLSADILDPAAPWPLRENAGGVIGATEIIVRVYVYAIAYSGASTIVCFLYSLPDTSIKRWDNVVPLIWDTQSNDNYLIDS